MGLRGCNETHFPKATKALPCPGPTWELTALIRPSTALDHSVHQPPKNITPLFFAKLPLNWQTVQVPPFLGNAPSILVRIWPSLHNHCYKST